MIKKPGRGSTNRKATDLMKERTKKKKATEGKQGHDVYEHRLTIEREM